ncbi:magnesium transporter CorA family protein [Candidatus Kaiserbacteria bacterium]|nr:magnesium transporter CorA family protein [Candidatus Kaiserbacteria bacterium]
MLSRHEHRGLVWVDMESPNPEEVKSVMDEFHIQPLTAEELLLPSSRPRAEFYPSYAYLVLHFPALRHTHKHREQEVDFVIGKNFIITTRYELIDPLHKFSKVFEVNSVLETSNVGEHAGFIFFAMLKRMYKSIEHELDFVRRDLSTIEEHVFAGDEVSMVAAISRSARDLLSLRQTIEPHRESLHTLESEGIAFFGADFTSYLRALTNEYYKVHNHIMRLTDSLHELRETNNSLLSTKQNETMKIFTIMAFVTFPLMLVAALFSMDTKFTPIVGLPHDFWIIVALMATSGIAMFAFFRSKKWL